MSMDSMIFVVVGLTNAPRSVGTPGKSKVLKKYYDHFKTHAETRLADPVHLGINKVNWLKLTDEFHRVNTVRHYKCGLTKKQQTMMARASQKAPTRMGSKFMNTYRAEYAYKFKKACNPTIVMDCVYGVADPILGEERDPMSEEVITIAQQRISTDLIEACEKLNSRYNELIISGTDENIAYIQSTQEVFPGTVGKLDWSDTYKRRNMGGKENMSIFMVNEMKAKQDMMEQELAVMKTLLKREREEARQREDTMMRMIEYNNRGEGSSNSGGSF